MHNAIVILQGNSARANNLASSSKSVSQAVFIVQSLPELQALVAQFPISVGVVDLGVVTVQEVVRLRHQLGMEIVCTHHTPDDVMWTAALNAGASTAASTTTSPPSAAPSSKPPQPAIVPHRELPLLQREASGGRFSRGECRRHNNSSED